MSSCKPHISKIGEYFLFRSSQRFGFHLSSFERVTKIFPVAPVNTVTQSGVRTFQVAAIQVGMVTITVAVPPSSLEFIGTVIFMIVVLLILCGEFHIAMYVERVARSPYNRVINR